MTRGLWLGSRTGTDHSQAPIGKEWARRTELLRPNPVTGKREDGTAAASVKPRRFKPIHDLPVWDATDLRWSGLVSQSMQRCPL